MKTNKEITDSVVEMAKSIFGKDASPIAIFTTNEALNKSNVRFNEILDEAFDNYTSKFTGLDSHEVVTHVATSMINAIKSELKNSK